MMIILPVLAGCSDSRQAEEPSVVAVSAEAAAAPTTDGIPWYPGTVEEAFAAAAVQNKPVFLYWGAEWCPPCHELKSTIFLREEFISLSRLFVPVYLDGDTERAQRYGEQFGVYGYPTVIIFDQEGVEVTRIPGGMDIERYLSVLELALNALQPVSELLLALEKGLAIRDEDWTLLANYSWGQDRGRALGEREPGTVLEELARACPPRLSLEKSQLQMLAIAEWAGSDGRDPLLAQDYLGRVQQILADEALFRANLSVFIYAGADLITALADGQELNKLLEMMLLPLGSAIEDPDVNLLTRVELLYAWVEANKVVLPEGESLTPRQQAWVSTRVEAARKELNSYQLHTALSTISQLYFELGLDKEAREAALQGISVSDQPYYFMSIMAFIERESGNDSEAIGWYRQAWDASRGPATRVQWGTNYLYALLETTPDDLAAIGDTADLIFSELEAQVDGLHHRNSIRLDRLSARLLAWATPADGDANTIARRGEVLEKLRANMLRVCESLDVAPESPGTCETFLVVQDPAAESI
jgi:thioredoxin-related protein